MAEITGFTAARMLEIENNTIVDGAIVGDDLILTTFGGTDINAGNVRGPVGPEGPIGEVSQAELDAALVAEHVGTAQLSDGSVTEPKLATSAVTTNKIATDAVNGNKIADNAVGSEHIISGAVGNSELSSNAVTAAKIADNAVGSEHIQTNAVGSSEIANGAVGNSQLASDAVTGAKIGNDQINSEHYAAGSIDPEHLANNAVTEAKILNGAVTRNKLDIIYAKEWADWSGSEYILGSTTPQGMMNVFGVTCASGSLIEVHMQVDVAMEVTGGTVHQTPAAVFFPRINGTTPAGLQGQLLFIPGKVEAGFQYRQTISGTWIFQATTSYSNAYITMVGHRNVANANVEIRAVSGPPGCSEDESHSWIHYRIFRA